jgi:hypothetical protein
VVLGKWDGQDSGYIGEAREHGGIFFDTGTPTWKAMADGLEEPAEHAVAWPVNEQFLRAQMENHVPRIEYVLPDGLTASIRSPCSAGKLIRPWRSTFSISTQPNLDIDESGMSGCMALDKQP